MKNLFPILLALLFQSATALDKRIEQNKSIPLDSSKSTTILYVFSGSDWCSNCIRFKKTVLTDSLFIQTMSSNQIRIEIIDFPQRTKQSAETIEYNRRISEKFGFDGTFPSFVLYDSNQKQFKTFRYQNEGVSAFCDLILAQNKLLHE
jgi:thioredoxin-related protein